MAQTGCIGLSPGPYACCGVTCVFFDDPDGTLQPWNDLSGRWKQVN